MAVFFLCSPECPKQSRLHFHFTNYFITISVRIPECNLVFNFLTLLFSTNRQKRRFLLPYECCMFCSLYFGKWQSKRYTYTQNTCPLESEEQKDLPLYYHWIQNIVQPNQEKHVAYTLSYRLLINYHSVENESKSQL